MTETTNEEQIKIWKKELAAAMADKQWRLALKLCSWLRYTLSQQGLSDPKVEKAHQQAKKALLKQMDKEETQQEREREREERHQRLRRTAMYHISSGNWDEALDSIETLYEDGTDHREAARLLQELKMRFSSMLSPKFREMDQRATKMGKRFDEVVERVGAGSLLGGSLPRAESG